MPPARPLLRHSRRRRRGRPRGRQVTVMRRITAAVVAAVAAGAVLTGCGANTDRGHAGDNRRPGPVRGADGAPEDGGSEWNGQGTDEDRGPERAPDASQLSTFALDVDTASYGYAKRRLDQGSLPSPSDVRYEEFVNSFRQDYPAPRGDGF